MTNYTVVLLAGLVGLFAVQAFSLQAVGGRTVKSESNFFSSLGRIQAGARNGPEIMLLGSSITGRLPDRAQGFQGVANLGCDGGSAADTIRAIDEGRLPCAPVLVIEANALPVAMKGDAEVAEAMRSPWFRMGMRFPLVSAYARPAAFVYSPLLARRTGGFGEVIDDDLGVVSLPVSPDPAWQELEVGVREAELANELAERLQRIKHEGSRVVVVWLPPARSTGQPVPEWVRLMISRSGCEWWDLGQDAGMEEIVLTDRVHMNGVSAAKTLRSLVRGLELSAD